MFEKRDNFFAIFTVFRFILRTHVTVKCGIYITLTIDTWTKIMIGDKLIKIDMKFAVNIANSNTIKCI